MIDLVNTAGSDAATKLAKDLVATKFNLAEGSEPWILPYVEQADAFLVDFPPGSDPQGADAAQAKNLRKPLIRYNSIYCENP